jgi:hypothetical protein
MSKLPLLCFCLFCPSFLFAQYDDLLKNSDISWVAEYTADFSLDPSLDEFNFFSFSNDLNVMQFGDAPGASGLFESNQNYSRYLSRKIVDDIREGAYAFFEDELLEIPISPEKMQQRLTRVDTVATFDPETYEEKLDVRHRDFDWDLLTGFRVRQVFYYNKTTKIFGSRVLAIAPLALPKDWAEIMTNESAPLIWLKIELPKNTEKITPKDVSYAFETKMRSNAPGLQDFVLKKGRIDFLSLIVNEVANPSHPIFDSDFKPIEPSKLQNYVLTTDTVVTYNAETFEEHIEIVERNAIRDVAAIGFVQHWFYDERKNLLFNRVVAIAPERMRNDGESNIRFSKTLFYILNK